MKNIEKKIGKYLFSIRNDKGKPHRCNFILLKKSLKSGGRKKDIISIHKEILVHGIKKKEIFYSTGNKTTTFEYIIISSNVCVRK